MKIVMWWAAGMTWLYVTLAIIAWTLKRGEIMNEFNGFGLYFMTTVGWVSLSVLSVIFFWGPRFG